MEGGSLAFDENSGMKSIIKKYHMSDYELCDELPAKRNGYLCFEKTSR